MSISRSLRSFIQKYRPKMAYIVNLTMDKTIQVEHTQVRFIPYWYILFKDILI